MSDHPYPKAVERFPRLRQSLLGTFDDCALQAHFDILYRKGWDSHPQGRGQLLHRTLAKCLEEMHRHGEEQMEADAALGILHEVLRQADVDEVCHEPGCDLPATVIPREQRTDDGRTLECATGHRHTSSVVNVPMREVKDLYWVVRKWSFDNRFDVTRLVSIEERLQTTINYPDTKGGHVERVLTGQVDALFLDADDPQHAIVLDWKDTWALPAPTEVSFEGYFQQRFYGLLVMKTYSNIQRVTLREFYVRFSEPREVTITRESLGEIEAELSALAERFDRAYETDAFKPTPGKHCSYCPRPAKCPIPVFTRGEGRITDTDQAQKVAAQLLVADQVVKQTTKALRAWAEAHGPIPVKNAKGESYYGFEESLRVARPDAAKAEQAQMAGVPVSTLYRKSKTSRFGLMTKKPKSDVEENSEILAAYETWKAGLPS